MLSGTLKAQGTIQRKSFNVDNLAYVVFEITRRGSEGVAVIAKLRKKENVNKTTVTIGMNYENFRGIFYCSDQWTDIKLQDVNSKSRYELRDNTIAKICDIHSYLLVVYFTVVHEVAPSLFNDNKLYHDEESTDFELCAADGSVAVHKAILFIHSDMLRTMLRGEWKETAEGRVSVEGVTAQTLRHLKDYMYLGALPDEGLEPLLRVAARYFMDNLKAACVAKLVKSVKPENFDDLVKLACHYNIPEMVRALVFEIPDDVLTSIYQFTVNKKEVEDEK